MFELDDDIMRQLRATFKIEAAEHIQAMNRVLLALEENPDGDDRQPLLEEIFREAHSLKGAAGAADFGEVEKTAHKLESVFGVLKSGKIKLTRDLCDVLYEGIDAAGLIVDAALEERPHGLDLPDLHTRLAAAEQGQAIPRRKPATQEVAAPQAPAVDVETPAAEPSTTPAVVEAPAAKADAKVDVKPEVKAEAKPETKPDVKAKSGKGDGRKAGPVIEDTIRVATNKIDSLMTQAG